jgi:hypothetical protein
MASSVTIKHGDLADRVYHITRWSLSALFIFSGLTKLVEPVQFAVLIDAYGILPEVLIMPVALLLPAVEVIAGGGLIFNVRGSLTTITLLMVLFLAVLGYGIWMGLDVDCGCFGPEDPEAQAFHGLRQAFYRDIGIMAVVAFLYVWRYRRAVRPVRLLNIL